MFPLYDLDRHTEIETDRQSPRKGETKKASKREEKLSFSSINLTDRQTHRHRDRQTVTEEGRN